MTRPTAATIVFVPIASPSSRFGNTSVTSAAALAKRNAPPTPCSDAPEDQLGAGVGEARAERAEREDEEAENEGVLAAEEVGQPAGGEHSTVEMIM